MSSKATTNTKRPLQPVGNRKTAATRSVRGIANSNFTPPQPADVIVISDSEEDTSLQMSPPAKRRRSPIQRTKEKPTTSRSRSQKVDQSRRSLLLELEQAQEELKSLRTQLKRAEKRLQDALEENLIVKADSSKKPDLGALEDYITCEICSGVMWTPYILPGCGHTFCEGCLHGWFNAVFNKFITAHPEYYQLEIPPEYQNVPEAQELLAQARRRRGIPEPTYTCPACREEAKVKPVENFSMKAVVREVAKMLGEPESPKKSKSNVSDGPFDGFFNNLRS